MGGQAAAAWAAAAAARAVPATASYRCTEIININQILLFICYCILIINNNIVIIDTNSKANDVINTNKDDVIDYSYNNNNISKMIPNRVRAAGAAAAAASSIDNSLPLQRLEHPFRSPYNLHNSPLFQSIIVQPTVRSHYANLSSCGGALSQ